MMFERKQIDSKIGKIDDMRWIYIVTATSRLTGKKLELNNNEPWQKCDSWSSVFWTLNVPNIPLHSELFTRFHVNHCQKRLLVLVMSPIYLYTPTQILGTKENWFGLVAQWSNHDSHKNAKSHKEWWGVGTSQKPAFLDLPLNDFASGDGFPRGFTIPLWGMVNGICRCCMFIVVVLSCHSM